MLLNAFKLPKRGMLCASSPHATAHVAFIPPHAPTPTPTDALHFAHAFKPAAASAFAFIAAFISASSSTSFFTCSGARTWAPAT